MSAKGFHIILKDELSVAEITPMSFARRYDSANYKTAHRALLRYINCESVPRYAKARDVLSHLNIFMTEDDLIESLLVSEAQKKVRDATYRDSKYVKKSISLRVDKLSNTLKYPADILLALNARIKETTTKGEFNEYIQRLVERDIDYGVLPNKEDI